MIIDCWYLLLVCLPFHLDCLPCIFLIVSKYTAAYHYFDSGTCLPIHILLFCAVLLPASIQALFSGPHFLHFWFWATNVWWTRWVHVKFYPNLMPFHINPDLLLPNNHRIHFFWMTCWTHSFFFLLYQEIWDHVLKCMHGSHVRK